MQYMKNRWSDSVGDHPLPEYPRPQFRRESYLNLNGIWDCCFSETDDFPESYDLKILVPFSPEAGLSGVGRVLQPGEILWYRRKLVFPEGFLRDRVLLHFGAVDQICEVFVNGKSAGTNLGGYYAFSFDITDLIREENEIVVKVRDYTDTRSYETGKQRLKPGRIWYTPQSGIWQTVWIESVPETYLRSVKMTPELEQKSIRFEFDPCGESTPIEIAVSFEGRELVRVSCEKEATVRLKDIHEWSPESPALYDVRFCYGEDTVDSYFAMRSIGVKKAKDGHDRIFLNGKPYFCNGLLDQGYWSDGLYTAPSEDAMLFDILGAKKLGFNTIRKHIKIEPLRWYYLCDKLGLLVFQDMVNGGQNYSFWTIMLFQLFRGPIKDDAAHYKGFGRLDEEGREQFMISLERMIRQLYNMPSVVMWTPFNEGWGQFESKTAYEKIKALDPSRLVDHASGWHDQGGGDMDSHHRYKLKIKVTGDKRGQGRPYILSEFGGLKWKLPEHSFNEKRLVGRQFHSFAELNAAISELYRKYILGNVPKGMAAAIYTQVSDIEEEVNGIFTYDREVTKLQADTLAPIFTEIKALYEKY